MITHKKEDLSELCWFWQESRDDFYAMADDSTPKDTDDVVIAILTLARVLLKVHEGEEK